MLRRGREPRSASSSATSSLVGGVTTIRIHICGGPAAGKSTLARRLAGSLELPLYELDDLYLAARMPIPAEMRAEAERMAGAPAWVSEGTYADWAEPFYQHADVVVWVEVRWRVAAYRIVARHVKAEFTRRNRFPRWRRLYRFWCWCYRYYHNQNPAGLNIWGTPNTYRAGLQVLEPYRSKVVSLGSPARQSDG